MDETVTMFSILSGLKAPHQLYTCSNFFLNSIHGFGLVWKEKQYLKRTRGEVGRR